MTPANDIGFQLNKACAQGDLAAVQALAPQWDGLTYGKFLSTAVQSYQQPHHMNVVEYLLELNNLPSEVARAMEYATDGGHWDLLPVLAEYLDDYFCGVELERAARAGKTTAVQLLVSFAPPHFTLGGLNYALTQKNDDIVDILAPLHSSEDVHKYLMGVKYKDNQDCIDYYTQWVTNQHTKKILTDVVQPHTNSDALRRKM